MGEEVEEVEEGVEGVEEEEQGEVQSQEMELVLFRFSSETPAALSLQITEGHYCSRFFGTYLDSVKNNVSCFSGKIFLAGYF